MMRAPDGRLVDAVETAGEADGSPVRKLEDHGTVDGLAEAPLHAHRTTGRVREDGVAAHRLEEVLEQQLAPHLPGERRAGDAAALRLGAADLPGLEHGRQGPLPPEVLADHLLVGALEDVVRQRAELPGVHLERIARLVRRLQPVHVAQQERERTADVALEPRGMHLGVEGMHGRERGAGAGPEQAVPRARHGASRRAPGAGPPRRDVAVAEHGRDVAQRPPRRVRCRRARAAQRCRARARRPTRRLPRSRATRRDGATPA